MIAAMAKVGFATVDDYLAAQPPAVRPVLEQMRAAIRAALPDAEERISYQMPSFRQFGATLIYFAGWKQHVAIYPANDAVVAQFADALAAYVVTKGAIRFPLDQPIPYELITAIAAERAKAARAGAQSRD